MRLATIIESERLWQQLEMLLDMYDRAVIADKPRKTLKQDILTVSREWATALDREAKAS